MDIAFLTSTFMREKKESTTITLLMLARELKKRGHTVVIISEAKQGYSAFEEMDGVPVYRLFSGKIFAHARSLDDVQKKLGLKFDVIHGFSSSPVLALRVVLARRLFGRKAWAIHTIKSDPKRFAGFARTLNRVDAVTVPTQVMKDKFVARGVNESKIHIIRSFIDASKFVPKKKLGKNRVLYYGSFFEKKGVEYLVRAFPSVLKNVPTATLVLAPRHPTPAHMLKMITDLGIKKQVVILDSINAVKEVQAADVVVLPYVDMTGTEGNPSCLLEAVACKTPVVTTRQAELLEIFDERGVFYAEPSDETSLAQQVVHALTDNKDVKERTDNAFLKISGFDIKKAADDFLELYRH